MNQQELFEALDSLGYPVAYDHFDGPQDPPFIVYRFTTDADVIADNSNYAEIGNFEVELYTAKKDTAIEALLQDTLKELELPYSKSETYISSEKMYQVIYAVQLVAGQSDDSST